MGTERQVVIFTLTAFKSDAVHKAFKINHSQIAILRGTILHADVTRIALAHLLDFLIDFFIFHLNGRFLRLQAFIFAQLHFRLHGNLYLNQSAVLTHLLHFRFIGS